MIEITENVNLQPGAVSELAAINGLETSSLEGEAAEGEMTAQEAILYDRQKIGRGIRTWITDHQVELKLFTPADPDEVKLLFQAARNILKFYKGTAVTVNGQKVFLTSLDALEKQALEDNEKDLEDLKDQLAQEDHVDLPCAVFPVAMDQSDLAGANLGQRLDSLQRAEVVFAEPRFYDMKKGTFGVFAVKVGEMTVLPKDVKVLEEQLDFPVAGWKVRLSNGKILDYDKFIRQVKAQRFDATRVVGKFPEKKKFLFFG